MVTMSFCCFVWVCFCLFVLNHDGIYEWPWEIEMMDICRQLPPLLRGPRKKHASIAAQNSAFSRHGPPSLLCCLKCLDSPCIHLLSWIHLFSSTHCRKCGQSFCRDCCHTYIPVPISSLLHSCLLHLFLLDSSSFVAPACFVVLLLLLLFFLIRIKAISLHCWLLLRLLYIFTSCAAICAWWCASTFMSNSVHPILRMRPSILSSCHSIHYLPPVRRPTRQKLCECVRSPFLFVRNVSIYMYLYICIYIIIYIYIYINIYIYIYTL